MGSSSLLLLLLLLFLILFMFHGPHGVKGEGGVDLVDEICIGASETQPNIDNDFCMESLRAAPEYSNTTTDLQQLGVIAGNLTLNNGAEIVSHITNLLKDQHVDQTVKKRLEVCLGLYKDSITYVEQAIGDITSEDFFNAIDELSAVMAFSSTCESGFTKKKILGSPLKNHSNNFFQLAAITLEITKYLN